MLLTIYVVKVVSPISLYVSFTFFSNDIFMPLSMNCGEENAVIPILEMNNLSLVGLSNLAENAS